MRITGKEKAILGGLAAGLVTIIVQLQQSGQLTLKEFGYAVLTYAITHITVYATTNTPSSTPPPPVNPQ